MRHWNRREFLKAGSCAVGASLLGGHLFAEGGKKLSLEQIIDTHTHFYDPTRPEGVPFPNPKDELLYHKTMPSDFVKVTEPFGVTGTVVVEASHWLEDNQWLLDLAEANPVILGVVGNLKAGEPEFIQNLARFSKNPLYKGLRINTPFSRIGPEEVFLKNMQAFAETGLIVDVNGGASGFPEILALKKRVPELRIVVEHLPRTPVGDPDAVRRQAEAFEELGSLPDVYAKVSYVIKGGVPNVSKKMEDYRSELDHIWSVFGPDKVFYGSNWPVCLREATYGEVIDLMLAYLAERGQEQAEKYFWKNARSAYRLTRPGITR